MAQTGRRTGPPLRLLLGVAGALAMFGPVLAVLVVGWAVSLTLALVAGLAVSLLLAMGLVAGGWWLIQRLEDLAPRTPLKDRTLSAPRSGPERGEPEKQGALSHRPTPETQDPTPHLLLVEDDPITQRIVVRLLRHLGVQADVVGDGQAALDAVAAHEYALVLMDCQLPVLDGYGAAAEIRRREAAASGRGVSGPGASAPPSRRLPIIALTVSALDAERQRALAAGMDEHLSKPLDHERLAALLVRWGLRQEPTSTLAPELRADRPPVLDPAGLPTVNGRLGEPYREIVQLYRQEAVRRMAALEAAARLPDRPQVAKIAHMLAGSSSSIGAARLAAACAALEALAKEPGPSALAHTSQASASSGVHAGDDRAHGDRALAEAIQEVRRELGQLDAALAHLTVERPPL